MRDGRAEIRTGCGGPISALRLRCSAPQPVDKASAGRTGQRVGSAGHVICPLIAIVHTGWMEKRLPQYKPQFGV